jgi:hypothetical protein
MKWMEKLSTSKEKSEKSKGIVGEMEKSKEIV